MFFQVVSHEPRGLLTFVLVVVAALDGNVYFLAVKLGGGHNLQNWKLSLLNELHALEEVLLRLFKKPKNWPAGCGESDGPARGSDFCRP